MRATALVAAALFGTTLAAWSPAIHTDDVTSVPLDDQQTEIRASIGADGGPVTKLTSEARRADRPTWAGADLMYSAETPDDRVEIKRIDVGTRKVDQLTDGASNESPTVAPNGRHIAFVTTRWGNGEQIAVMSLDGKNVRQVTFVGNNRYPSWSASPQGR